MFYVCYEFHNKVNFLILVAIQLDNNAMVRGFTQKKIISKQTELILYIKGGKLTLDWFRLFMTSSEGMIKVPQIKKLTRKSIKEVLKTLGALYK